MQQGYVWIGAASLLSGQYLIDWSFCLLSGSLFLVVFYPFAFFWAYGPTIRKEEAILFDLHSEAYLKDSFKIPQVFPDSASATTIKNLFDGFSLKRVSLKEYGRILKFCSIAFLLATIDTVKIDGFIEGIKGIIFPTKNNFDACLLALCSLALYVVSVLVLHHSGRDAREKL